MGISQVGQADFRLAETGHDNSSGADFDSAVKTSRFEPSEVKTEAQGSDSKLDGLLQKLLAILQPSGGDQQSGGCHSDGVGSQHRPMQREHGRSSADEQGYTTRDQPTAQQSAGQEQPAAQKTAGQSDTADLLQQVITLLNKQLVSGQLDSKQADLIAKLLPLLEQKLVSSAGPQQSQSQSETDLLGQLTDLLGGTDAQNGSTKSAESDAPSGTQKTTSSSSSTSLGIGSDEIDAMIAHANGQGPEVNFASYTSAS